MGAEKTYVRGVSDELGYLATWLPTTNIHVGDIGHFDGCTFVPTSSLGARAIKFGVERDSSAVDMTMQRGSGFKMTTKLKGSALGIAPSIPSAKAGVVLEFSSKEGAVLAATGCVEDRIADSDALRKTILDLYDHWQWDRDYVVVTHVVKARRTTVLVSDEGASKFELTASGSGKAGTVELADISAGFSLTSSYNSAYAMVGRKDMTPMFRAVRIKGIWPKVDWVASRLLEHMNLVESENILDVPRGTPMRVNPGKAPVGYSRRKVTLEPVKATELVR